MSLRSRTPPRHTVPFQRVDKHMDYLRSFLYAEMAKVVGDVPMELAAALIRCLQKDEADGEYSDGEYSDDYSDDYSDGEYSGEDEKED